MNSVFAFVIMILMATFRSRLSLQFEIAALRHQLGVYQRAQRRPTIASVDRFFWSLLARLWGGWRDALFFVQPRTVIQWQRRRFRDHWRRLSYRNCRGRPVISAELRSLNNHFNQERHLYSRKNFKLNRSAALAEWRELSVA